MVESNTSKGVTPMHPLAQLLLKEFAVFLNDLPPVLPLLRGIEHLDVPLGAPFSNKLAYRCNPSESKELQRKFKNC